LNSQSDSSSCY